MSEWIDLLFLAFFAAINGTYGLLVALSVLEIVERRATRMPEFDTLVLSDASSPPISVLAPAYNEATTIVDSVRSYLQLDYPNHQVVVINDGSTDDTLERLEAAFDLEPIDLVVRSQVQTGEIKLIYQSKRDARLLVVDKENGGKADALNVGLNVSRTPLVCCVDSDTIIERRALLRMVEPFLYDEQHVVAVGGTVRVANGCEVKDGLVQRVDAPRSWLARFQVVEYLRAFLFGRMGFNRLGGNLIISGAFGLFLREAVIEAGGYQHDSIGEDMELVARLHRTQAATGVRYRVVHIPDPVCYTEVPEQLSVLARQRDRWQRGLADSLWRHRTMMLNPRYGLVGMVVFPIFVLFELLGPLIELSGYVWFVSRIVLGEVSPMMATLFFLVALFVGFLISVQSLILDDLNSRQFHGVRSRLALLAAAMLENFGYRQLTLLWRWKGLWKFLVGIKSWGKMTRKGFRDRLSTREQGVR